MTSPLDEHFDKLFQADSDPWRTQTRWYERRKRALVMAMLPRERYRRAFEPGCGAGELTVALADRCDELIASDASLGAVARAHDRLRMRAASRQGATMPSIVQGRVPDDWPQGLFDLIVLSEVAYYLDAPALRQLAYRCSDSLSEGGTLLACHWRRGAADLIHAAHEVHGVLTHVGDVSLVAHYEDADVLIDAWGCRGMSVAQAEGLA